MSGKRAADELQILRECPFCGGKAFVARGMRDRIGLWHSAVLCENPECGASVPCTPATDPSDSMQEAANRWDRRHERTCHDTAENIGFSVVRTFTCSECGETANIVRRSPSFCPFCGRNLREGDE